MTSTSKTKMKVLDITGDDSKVLGKSQTRFLSKSVEHFQTNKYMTYHSAWTPVIHRPSNEQIYKERRDLIGHWFDLWNDSQRKRFLDLILKKCGKSQLIFAHNWFESKNICIMRPSEDLILALQAKAVISRIDMTAVLPRFLSMYIFSFLDVKSLCRAAQVSWSWKFVSEQDALWRPKAMKQGWLLPYQPSSTEYGSWKRHYIECATNLDILIDEWPKDADPLSSDVNYMYQSLTDARRMLELYERMNILDGGHQVKPMPIAPEAAKEILRARPPWQSSSVSTNDIEAASNAYYRGLDPNDPVIEECNLLHRNKHGQVKERSRSNTNPYTPSAGLRASARRDRHRATTVSGGPVEDMKKTLSEITIKKYKESLEKTMNELVAMPWKPVTNHIRSNVASSDDYHESYSVGIPRKFKVSNPRIVFISSRVPASQLLHDAVLNEVCPIPYEYEGTTVDNLIARLSNLLDGQLASSIALVAHSTQPGELCILQDCVVTLDQLNRDKIVWLFQSLANYVKPSDEGGSVDIFCPLAASEPGIEMLIQLNILTGIRYSAPTGMSGQWNVWESDWYNRDSPPVGLYFEKGKTITWSNLANIVTDAISHTQDELQHFFDQTKLDVMHQITGQIVLDAMALGNTYGLTRISPYITEALAQLGSKQNVDPIEFMADFFSSLWRERQPERQPNEELPAVCEDDDDEEKQDFSKEKTGSQRAVGGDDLNDALSNTFLTTGKSAMLSSLSASNTLNTFKNRRVGAFNSSLSMMGQTAYKDHPSRQFIVAKEILSTEVSYVQELQTINKLFVMPLKRGIQSNRAVIASSVLQQIFSDVMIIHDIHGELLRELKPRIRDWSASTCIGDVFVKFTTRLPAYVDYITHYPQIISALDNEVEINPNFRAFLKRQEKTPATRMKSLYDLLMEPMLRMTAYVRLLGWLKANTPKSHPDRNDLTLSLQEFKEVERIIRQTKSQLQRDRRLQVVNKTIECCPNLLEANRIYLTKHDFSLMEPKYSSAVDNSLSNRVYTHVEDVGLFLFNDALVFTHIFIEHHPFERSFSKRFMFQRSLSLVGLKVRDLPDTRYLKKAFQIKSGEMGWILSSEGHSSKFEFISNLEAAIRTAVEEEAS